MLKKPPCCLRNDGVARSDEVVLWTAGSVWGRELTSPPQLC